MHQQGIMSQLTPTSWELKDNRAPSDFFLLRKEFLSQMNSLMEGMNPVEKVVFDEEIELLINERFATDSASLIAGILSAHSILLLLLHFLSRRGLWNPN